MNGKLYRLGQMWQGIFLFCHRKACRCVLVYKEQNMADEAPPGHDGNYFDMFQNLERWILKDI